MDIEQVYAQFAFFAGLSSQAAVGWHSLCDAVVQRLTSRLRPDADAADARLVLAAAGEAYYQYSLAQGTGTAQSVRVGDIAVSDQSGGANGSNIQRLRDELLWNAAELLECSFAGLRQVG